MMNIPYNNYKTQSCKYYDKDKSCKFGANCSFAHGAHELRNPYDTLPPIMPPNPSQMMGASDLMFDQSAFLAPPPQPQQMPDVKLLILD